MKTKTIADGKIRRQIRDFIEEALSASITSYRTFMDGSMDKTKRDDFEKNHKAGNIALAHIETLMELAAVADIPDEDGYGMELSLLLQEASVEIDKFREEQKEEREDE